jgi:hypothetical protein
MTEPAGKKPEEYPEDWARVVLMVSPDGEMNAIGGDREPGEGDAPYVGLERIKAYISKTMANAVTTALDVVAKRMTE